MRPLIYLDNAATTKLEPRVIQKMKDYMGFYGNPSATYQLGYNSKNIIDESRKTIADCIGIDDPCKIIFTSGGSESDNWALFSTFGKLRHKGTHIITTSVEHHAILHTCEYLRRFGADVTYLDVDSNGMIDLNELESAIRPETILISVMTANNEIGTIYPIREISEIAHMHGVLFHTDAVQAFGHIPLDFINAVDMFSVSGHKFGGPKGTGFLYVKNPDEMIPFINGGGQEYGLRAGTENVIGIAGMAEAAEISNIYLNSRNSIVKDRVKKLSDGITGNITGVRFNGDPQHRLPNNLSVTFDGIRGEQLIRLLDMNGIYASTGSACNSSSTTPSHVLKAIGLSDEEANATIRFSLSHENTVAEIDYVVAILKRSVEQLRRE